MWKIFVPGLIVSLGTIIAMMERARRKKLPDDLHKEGLNTSLTQGQKNELVVLGKILSSKVSDFICQTSDPSILQKCRVDVEKGWYGIYVGYKDPASDELGMPDGPDSYHGYPILSLSIRFRGKEKKILVCYEPLMRTNPSESGSKTSWYDTSDNSMNQLEDDVWTWISNWDRELAKRRA